MIHRLAVGAVAAGGFSADAIGPALALSVVGSLVVGPALGWVALRLFAQVQHVPTAIILQFTTTFGVWILAEELGLSAVLTMVCYAATVAQSSPQRTAARMRVPTYAVWETAVFALNIFAFIFIGLQMRPIVESLEPVDRVRYVYAAGGVLVTVIVVRLVWHMTFNAFVRWRHRRVGFNPPRPMLRPTVGSGLVISWAGMRGIVSLAAAMALPSGFPHRDLIMLTAFLVVLGTLVLQGLTLKPLLRWLNLRDDDPVGRELTDARHRALAAVLSTIAPDDSPLANIVRKEFKLLLSDEQLNEASDAVRAHHDLRHRALHAAREAIFRMRATEEIGDDAFHKLEEELDWLEMASQGKS